MSSASTQDGDTVAVMAPKDAEGREIPLDVDALYDKNGERLAIREVRAMSALRLCGGRG